MTRIKRLLVVTMMMWATTWSNVDAQSDGFFWWLQKVTTTPMPNTNPSTTTQGPVYCECVKYYLCIDNVISTSGVDVIDIRMARVGPPSVTNVKECPDVLDVCCGLPPSETTTPPITPTPTPTLPPDTPCECVSFFNCTRDRLVSNGGGNTTLELFGLGYSHSKCNQALAVCCALDPATPSPANITTVVTPLTEEECECVDPFQCDEHGYIITSGVGIINIRTRTHSRNDSYPDERCEDPSLVCCRPPRDLNSTTTPLPTTTTPPPTTTQQPAHGCGTRHSDGVRARILGFQEGESQFGEFPWVAAVLRVESLSGLKLRRFVGGGTLIHPRVVVTAAHKVKGYNKSDMVVRLGEWDTQSEQEPYRHQDVAVDDIVLHPGFVLQTLYHDVALLILKEESKFASHIDSICLAQDLSLVDPSACVINGWGLSGFENGEYQRIMKSLTLPLVQYKDCVNSLRTTRLGRYFRLHPSFTCAGGEKGKDACRGDGGGPLACPRKEDPKRYLLVGITAWGIGCGQDGIPGVYVNIPVHYDWITERIDFYFPTTTTSTTTPIPSTAPQYFEDLKNAAANDSEGSEVEGRSDTEAITREENNQGRQHGAKEQRLEKRKQQREERERRRQEKEESREERRRLREERQRERLEAKEIRRRNRGF